MDGMRERALWLAEKTRNEQLSKSIVKGGCISATDE
jgi:hypothetical protein